MRFPRLPWLVIFTSAFGLVTLLGYLSIPVFQQIQWVLVQWVVIIAAFALILGFFNVLQVHLERVARQESGWFYSLVLVLTAITVLIFGLGGGPGDEPFLWFFRWVLLPLGASIAALLVFILTYAAYRTLRLRRQTGGLIFLLSAIVILVGRIALVGPAGPLVTWFRDRWLAAAIGGMRGLILGVALGTIATGLRLLLGAERVQSE